MDATAILIVLCDVLNEWKDEWKKRSEETQTLRAGCSKAEPKNFAPQQTPSRPKFNQLEMVTTFTYKPSLVRIDARNFELSSTAPELILEWG